MNLLENYLIKVIKVELCNDAWTKEEWAKDKKWLCVKQHLFVMEEKKLIEEFIVKKNGIV